MDTRHRDHCVAGQGTALNGILQRGARWLRRHSARCIVGATTTDRCHMNRMGVAGLSASSGLAPQGVLFGPVGRVILEWVPVLSRQRHLNPGGRGPVRVVSTVVARMWAEIPEILESSADVVLCIAVVLIRIPRALWALVGAGPRASLIVIHCSTGQCDDYKYGNQSVMRDK